MSLQFDEFFFTFKKNQFRFPNFDIFYRKLVGIPVTSKHFEKQRLSKNSYKKVIFFCYLLSFFLCQSIFECKEMYCSSVVIFVIHGLDMLPYTLSTVLESPQCLKIPEKSLIFTTLRAKRATFTF